MNTCNFIGRLVSTPELKQTTSGLSVCSFTLAVKRPGTYGPEEKTDWIDMVAWRNSAEFICKQFEKGMAIAVRTQAQTRTREKDGVSFKETEFVVQEVEFIPKSKVKGEGTAPARTETPKHFEPREVYGSMQSFAQGNDADFQNVDMGEDLPF